MGLKDTGLEAVDWIKLVEVRDVWLALLNDRELPVLYNAQNFLPS
jgi:hypothetical protein